MDTYVIIIIAVVAALAGAAIAWLVRPKPSQGVEQDKMDSPEVKKLEVQLQARDETINDLSESVKTLKKKIEAQNKELSEATNLKIVLQSGDENTVAATLQNEIEKLKKQVRDAEDEIDELEDEAGSYKRKYNEQRAKQAEAEQAAELCRRDLKESRANLEAAEDELKEKTESLNKKSEAIDFVNEILLAKDAENKDVLENNKKLVEIESCVENDLYGAFDQINVWNKQEKEEWKSKIWQWGNLQRKTWLRGKKVIAFVGEFSAGKTSIVNRILSQDNGKAPKLPVSSKATTAIATYISYGSDFNSQFTDPNGKLKNISRETFEKVSKDILKEVNVSPVITYFVMSYNNMNLQDLSILDTPGFSSNDKEDAQRTAEAIKEADALFWVFDANTGEINQASLNIIREHLQRLPLYVVINKADTKSPAELDKLEAHIKGTIQKNNISVNGYLRFSQKETITKLMEIVKAVPDGDSDKDSYIYEIYRRGISFQNELDAAYKQRRQACVEAERARDLVLEHIEESLAEINGYCDFVKEMPEFTTKFFGSDYFKITMEQYGDFAGSLEAIGERKSYVENLSRELADSSEGLQKAQNELDDIKENSRLLRGALDRFEKAMMQWDRKFKEDYRQWENRQGTAGGNVPPPEEGIRKNRKGKRR